MTCAPRLPWSLQTPKSYCDTPSLRRLPNVTTHMAHTNAHASVAAHASNGPTHASTSASSLSTPPSSHPHYTTTPTNPTHSTSQIMKTTLIAPPTPHLYLTKQSSHNLSARISTIDNPEGFPTSNERTPIPFPQPINHSYSSSNNAIYANAAILEDYDIAGREIESGEVVVQSIENDVDVDVDQERERGGMGGNGGVGEWIDGDGEMYAWRGRVEWPESGKRSSILREAREVKRRRDRREVDVGRDGERARKKRT